MENKLQELGKYAKIDGQYDNLLFSINERNINYDYTGKGGQNSRVASSTLFGSYVEKKNGIYCSDNILEIINSDDFNKLAREILADKFCSNIDLSTMRTDLTFRNQVVKMNIRSGSIHICLENILKIKKLVILSYCAGTDEINFKKVNGTLMERDVSRLLKVLVPKSVFSSYYRKLIDGSNCNKNISVVMNRTLSASCNFDIIEESDKYVLQKKKRK